MMRDPSQRHAVTASGISGFQGQVDQGVHNAKHHQNGREPRYFSTFPVLGH